ncbi:MAG: restriction endonuclease subunit S [Desulfobacterales bacterium]|nr:restriction endonuclease subunit S [Desulfobacterales bacterium]
MTSSQSFMTYLLNSPLILNHVQSLISGSASPHVNVRDIKKYPIPLPPLAEQH